MSWLSSVYQQVAVQTVQTVVQPQVIVNRAVIGRRAFFGNTLGGAVIVNRGLFGSNVLLANGSNTVVVNNGLFGGGFFGVGLGRRSFGVGGRAVGGARGGKGGRIR